VSVNCRGILCRGLTVFFSHCIFIPLEMRYRILAKNFTPRKIEVLFSRKQEINQRVNKFCFSFAQRVLVGNNH
jgi:hypothetical protein